MRPRVLCLVLALAFVATTASAGEAEQPLRFLVMGDPQFHVPREGAWEATLNYGYEWQSPAWATMPAAMERLGASRLFVCGDIFEYHDGDGTAVAELWDVWDRYLGTFAPSGRVEWVPGGHEFWGAQAARARDLFLERYSDHVRYVVRERGNVFALFDDVHSPDTFGTDGLDWLESVLKESQDADHIWFFGHVPPRNTAEWWPQRDGASTGEGGDRFRIRMAALLEQYGVRAAFFGHEHRETNLGDRGGFPMFVAGCRYPLLVEVDGPDVRYRWIMEPASDDPLAGSLPVDGPPLTDWRAAVLPDGAEVSDSGDLPDGLALVSVQATDGALDLGALPGVTTGSRVVAVSDYPLRKGWGTRCARIRSTVPYTLWLNGQLMESATATSGRFNGYQYSRRDRNRAVVVLQATGPDCRFTLIPHSFPPDMAAGD